MNLEKKSSNDYFHDQLQLRLSYLRTDIFGEPLPAFPVLSSAQLSKVSLLLLIKVLPERGTKNKRNKWEEEKDKWVGRARECLKQQEQTHTHASVDM